MIPRIGRIYREKLWFTEKYVPRKSMIYWELVLFTEKSYDLLRKSMIYREIQLFFEIFYALLNYDFYSFWHDFMLNQVQLRYKRSTELLASTSIIQYSRFKILNEITPALERHGVLQDFTATCFGIFKAVLVPSEESAKQIDDNSCGVFCLSFLDSIIRGLPISGRTTQAIVDKLRKDYAFEIFLNSTDPSE